MATALWSALGLILVVGVPGALIVCCTRVRLSLIEAVGVVPACSLAAVFLLGEAAAVVGLPFGVVAFVVALLALAVVAVVMRRRGVRPTIRGESVEDADTDDLEARHRLLPAYEPRPAALVLLGLAIVIGGATWISGISGGVATRPPNFDAAHHGFMTARIAEEESIAADDVLVSDPRTGDRAVDYYPLGLHASAAIVHRVTGVDIGYLLSALVVLFGAIVLPCGMYALTRALFPEEPLAAGFAAVVTSLMSMFPYKPIGWGGVTLIVGMSLVPVSVLLLWRALTGSRSVWTIGVTTLVLLAGFTVHNSQLPLIVGIVALLVAERAIRTRSWAPLRTAATRLLTVGVATAVLLVPILAAVLSGASERSDFDDTPTGGLVDYLKAALRFGVAVPPQGRLALLALVGIAIVVWSRRRYALVAGAAIIVALGALAATSDGPLSDALTFPWYRQPERINYDLVYFAPVFVGLGLAAGWRLVTRWAGPRPWAPWLATAAVVVVLVAANGLRVIDVNRDLVQAYYTSYMPVSADSVAAFDYLDAHTTRADSVLNDLDVDGSLWMYATSDVNPLFGLWPSANDTPRSWSERVWLHDHITELGDDPRVERLVGKYHVRFVYFGAKTFADSGHLLGLRDLRETPGLREVFGRGGSHVFAIEGVSS